jgi:hypothetical protein
MFFKYDFPNPNNRRDKWILDLMQYVICVNSDSKGWKNSLIPVNELPVNPECRRTHKAINNILRDIHSNESIQI